MEKKYYTKEDVERILSRVIKSRGFVGEKFSIEDILNIAKDLNLDPNQVILSIQEVESISEFERARILWKKKKKNEFFQHLAAYVLINFSFLMISGMLAPSIFQISIIIAILWAFGLLADFIESFFPSEEKIERGAQKLLRSKKWKERINMFIDNILDSLIDKKNKYR